MFTVSDISIDMNIENLVPYQLLSQLAPNYKIIYVSGNHEEGKDIIYNGINVYGGIIRLPLIGGLLSPDRTFFPKYDKGIYKINSSYMNVSAGLGDSIIKRTFNPPEINVLLLKNE